METLDATLSFAKAQPGRARGKEIA
jgi:hypothetical protein